MSFRVSALWTAACLASILVAPGLWSDYAATFGWENGATMSGFAVIAILPSWGGLDFLLRFAIAGAAAIYAVYSRQAWLAYAAAVITCPILAWFRFAPLVGLWRFRRAAEGESDAATTAVPDGAAV